MFMFSEVAIMFISFLSCHVPYSVKYVSCPLSKVKCNFLHVFLKTGCCIAFGGYLEQYRLSFNKYLRILDNKKLYCFWQPKYNMIFFLFWTNNLTTIPNVNIGTTLNSPPPRPPPSPPPKPPDELPSPPPPPKSRKELCRSPFLSLCGRPLWGLRSALAGLRLLCRSALWSLVRSRLRSLFRLRSPLLSLWRSLLLSLCLSLLRSRRSLSRLRRRSRLRLRWRELLRSRSRPMTLSYTNIKRS